MNLFIKLLMLLTVLSVPINAAEYRRTGSDGREYFINSAQSYNWYQALHKCGELNMQLLEIHSQQKNNVVLAILRSLFAKPITLWLGADDAYNEARDLKRPFYWSISGQRMTYSYWSKGNPDNYKSREHCVQIYDSESTWTWNDNECTRQMGYICEEHYLTTKYRTDSELERQAINNKNDQLSREFSKTQSEIQIINKNSQTDTDKVLSESQNSLDETQVQFKESFMTLILKRPYMEAVVADVGAAIDGLVAETQKEISDISQQTRHQVREVLSMAEKSSYAATADFSKKLSSNKKDDNALLA